MTRPFTANAAAKAANLVVSVLMMVSWQLVVQLVVVDPDRRTQQPSWWLHKTQKKDAAGALHPGCILKKRSRRSAMDKRRFLQATGGATLSLMLGPSLSAQYATKAAAEMAGEEPFWAAVRGQFRLTGDYINLENGYYCFQPEPVLD